MSDSVVDTHTILYRLDLTNDDVGTPIEIDSDTDFESYIEKLMEDFYNPSRFKAYKFSSETTEVAQAINGVDASNWPERAQVIASRLHRTERTTQEAIGHMVELRPGSLVQILTNIEGRHTLIFTKVDHSEFLDVRDLKSRAGLPYSRRVQKSAVFMFDDDSTISDIRISDTNKKISKYWWNDFFELEELNTSEKNSKTSFAAIEKTLRSELHKQGKNFDFWALRNAVISFYRTSDSFTFDSLMENVFDSYQPSDQSVDMNVIREKIRVLPEKHSFDTQFSITQSAINARVKNQILLAENLELKINGDIPNIENVIRAEISEDGRKFIKIYSDHGYNEFKTS